MRAGAEAGGLAPFQQEEAAEAGASNLFGAAQHHFRPVGKLGGKLKELPAAEAQKALLAGEGFQHRSAERQLRREAEQGMPGCAPGGFMRRAEQKPAVMAGNAGEGVDLEQCEEGVVDHGWAFAWAEPGAVESLCVKCRRAGGSAYAGKEPERASRRSMASAVSSAVAKAVMRT